jgi:hypothetical protein
MLHVPTPVNAPVQPYNRGAIQSDTAKLSIRESKEAWHYMAAAKLSDEAFSAILDRQGKKTPLSQLQNSPVTIGIAAIHDSQR